MLYKFDIYLLNLLLALCLCINIANSEEHGTCFATIDKNSTASYLIKDSAGESNNLFFTWTVKDTVTQSFHKTKTLYSSLEKSKKGIEPNFVSENVYKISDKGAKLEKENGSSTQYDPLNGRLLSFQGTTNYSIPYVVKNDEDEENWLASFNYLPAREIICKIVYNKDPLYETEYHPSKEKWDEICRGNHHLHTECTI
ncbi:MAG: hypothetical protein K0R94_437 [Burkholderiales bacterium]|jgi:hypothetical protein|nr:hypothetical protein [Burkholderiales bacterium]